MWLFLCQPPHWRLMSFLFVPLWYSCFGPRKVSATTVCLESLRDISDQPHNRAFLISRKLTNSKPFWNVTWLASLKFIFYWPRMTLEDVGCEDMDGVWAPLVWLLLLWWWWWWWCTFGLLNDRKFPEYLNPYTGTYGSLCTHKFIDCLTFKCTVNVNRCYNIKKNCISPRYRDGNQKFFRYAALTNWLMWWKSGMLCMK
jgi:hypothetical protein